MIWFEGSAHVDVSEIFQAEEGGAVEKCRPRDTAAEAFRSRLPLLIGELDQIPRHLEANFLHVGGGLHELRLSLRGIKEQAAAVASRLGGDELQRVIDGLRDVLGRMQTYAASADERVARIIDILCRILVEFNLIVSLVSQLRERVTALRMLKMLTNLQSVSLCRGASGFRSVAEDIGILSRNVQSKSEEVIRKTRQLQSSLTKVLAMVREIEQRQHGLEELVMQVVSSGSESLSQMHDSCAGVAREVAARSADIVSELGEVVVAMQFHDITRQQMQQARNVLMDIAITMGADGTATEWDVDPTSVCREQAVFLDEVVDELAAAGGDIRDNLCQIAANAGETSTVVRELCGYTDRIGKSSVGDIELGLGDVLRAFSDNAETSRALNLAMTTVSDTMGEIAGFMEDIDYIGAEIKLISLNAIVKAAHSGAEGAAMNVIAQTVKAQSEDICREAADISATISRITKDIDRLHRAMGDGESLAAREERLARMHDDLGISLDTLKGINDEVMDWLEQVEAGTGIMTAGIGEVLGRMDAMEMAERLRREVVLPLREMGAASEEERGEYSAPAAGTLYLLNRSRAEHHGFIGFDSPVAGPVHDQVGPEASAFGDNVELF